MVAKDDALVPQGGDYEAIYYDLIVNGVNMLLIAIAVVGFEMIVHHHWKYTPVILFTLTILFFLIPIFDYMANRSSLDIVGYCLTRLDMTYLLTIILTAVCFRLLYESILRLDDQTEEEEIPQ